MGRLTTFRIRSRVSSRCNPMSPSSAQSQSDISQIRPIQIPHTILNRIKWLPSSTSAHMVEWFKKYPKFQFGRKGRGPENPIIFKRHMYETPSPTSRCRPTVCMYCPPPRSLPILRIVRDIPDGQGSMDSVRLQQNWEYRAPLIGGSQVA